MLFAISINYRRLEFCAIINSVQINFTEEKRVKMKSTCVFSMFKEVQSNFFIDLKYTTSFELTRKFQFNLIVYFILCKYFRKTSPTLLSVD